MNWVMSHITCCRAWWCRKYESTLTYTRVMSRTNESFHVWMSHVTYHMLQGLVMSLVAGANGVREESFNAAANIKWVMSHTQVREESPIKPGETCHIHKFVNSLSMPPPISSESSRSSTQVREESFRYLILSESRHKYKIQVAQESFMSPLASSESSRSHAQIREEYFKYQMSRVTNASCRRVLPRHHQH